MRMVRNVSYFKTISWIVQTDIHTCRFMSNAKKLRFIATLRHEKCNKLWWIDRINFPLHTRIILFHVILMLHDSIDYQKLQSNTKQSPTSLLGYWKSSCATWRFRIAKFTSWLALTLILFIYFHLLLRFG